VYSALMNVLQTPEINARRRLNLTSMSLRTLWGRESRYIIISSPVSYIKVYQCLTLTRSVDLGTYSRTVAKGFQKD
jgi:hypothetical protein